MSHNLNRKQHKYTRPFQPVKALVEETFVYGIIISKFHKIPKQAKTEEPFYLITGHGIPIWEGHITPITEQEYSQIQEGGI
jgi:hypothetical protein